MPDAAITRTTLLRTERHTGRFALWFALFGGGVAWFARFVVIWIVAEFGCISGMLDVGGVRSPIALLTIASVPFLAVAAGAVYVAQRRQRSLEGNDARSSEHFMARAGLIASGIFLGIMLVEMIPIFYFLDECRSFSILPEV